MESNIRHAFERVNWRDHIKSDTSVFVKPNYTVPFFKPGVTTNKSVVEAVLNVLKDRASDVYIGEADGGDDSFTAEDSLRRHGVSEICSRTGATMLNLSKTQWIRVADKINGKKVEVTLPKPLLGMDESISIPVMKVHVATRISLSIKNLWGCHPSTLRLLDHKHISERLALIAKSINLRFAVIDGIYGLNKRGPMDGEVVNIGAILVGNNPVATDAVGARLMGFDPAKIDHIVVASRAGVGSYYMDDIEILEDLSPFQQHFCVNPNFVDRMSLLTFKSNTINKIVSDSIFTKPIYWTMGRKPRKKIVNPGDEI